MFSVYLVGNPNVGKTSLFNQMTNSFEHVGNWHGVTVAEKTKTVRIGENLYSITDLPGLYSLNAVSPEERITRDSIMLGKMQAIVNVIEAENLARNLYLTLSLLELGTPTVLVVNMADELKKHGKTLDCEKLSARLGVPVIMTSAAERVDTESIIKAAEKAAARGNKFRPRYADSDGFFGQIETDKTAAARIAARRYAYIDRLTEGVITQVKNFAPSRWNALDKIALNKSFAIPLFLLVITAVFFLTFGLVGGLCGRIIGGFFDGFLMKSAYVFLEKLGAADWIISLIVDALIGGIGGVTVFLPQIVTLLFLLAILEDSGYIGRLAFMTDGLFTKIGLTGRSVFTLLMGFGCSATAVLTTRCIDDEKTRIKTALLTPFMSCSARLPVYAAVGGAFFSMGSPIVICALYLGGAAIAIALAAVMQRIKPWKSGEGSFLMELPPYRLPKIGRIKKLLTENASSFLARIGTTVLAFDVIVWTLSSFSVTDGFVAGGEGSILQTLAGAISPAFVPLGFGNWRATTALLSGLIAKETVLATVQSLGGSGAIFFDANAGASALSFLTFTLLYTPCLATLSALKSELGMRYAALSAVVQTAVAYIASFTVYWAAVLWTDFSGMIWALFAAIIIAASVAALFRRPKPNGCGCCGAPCANDMIKEETL